jgi:micrococcal nuclease
MRSRARTLALGLTLVALTGGLSPRPEQAIDCTGHDSQIWAQSVFESNPTRYIALDPDGNGLACEELPPGAAPAWWTHDVPAGAESTQLTRVVDGDTIRVTLGGIEEPVRLILIDTPETSDPNNPPECHGQEATAYLEWLLSLGGTLYLETDVSDRDQFGRLLRYAWLDFGDGEVYLVNEVMARSGYAAESTFPPDVKYEEEIREAARFAREHGYGLWSACITDEDGDTNELTGPQSSVNTPDPQTEPAPVVPVPVPERVVVSDPVSASACDPSYPDVCITPFPPDLDCGDVPYGGFTVFPPDPHRFDGDYDGIGCEG